VEDAKNIDSIFLISLTKDIFYNIIKNINKFPFKF